MLRRSYDACVDEPSVGPLSLRQKLTFAVGAPSKHLSAEAVAQLPDETFDYGWFREHEIDSKLLRVAGVGVAQLRRRGVDTVHKLALLGFSALHLVDANFCTECVEAYGAESTLGEFLATHGDAIVLAGTSAVAQLGLDVGMLLLMCANRPNAARDVLLQCKPRGECLKNVPALTLIETGLHATQLAKLGFDCAGIREQTRATTDQLVDLGFL